MWMVDVKSMCRNHLLAEHLDVHMFVNALNQGLDLSHYINSNALEVLSLLERHNQLADEINSRSYKNDTPLPGYNITGRYKSSRIDKNKAREELMEICNKCKESLTRQEDQRLKELLPKSGSGVKTENTTPPSSIVPPKM